MMIHPFWTRKARHHNQHVPHFRLRRLRHEPLECRALLSATPLNVDAFDDVEDPSDASTISLREAVVFANQSTDVPQGFGPSPRHDQRGEGEGFERIRNSAIEVGAFESGDDAFGAAGPKFQVNTHTDSHQKGASVASTADGGFVFAWSSSGQDGSDREPNGVRAEWGRAEWGRAEWGRAEWGRAEWSRMGSVHFGVGELRGFGWEMGAGWSSLATSRLAFPGCAASQVSQEKTDGPGRVVCHVFPRCPETLRLRTRRCSDPKRRNSCGGGPKCYRASRHSNRPHGRARTEPSALP